MPELQPNAIILNTYQIERLLGQGAFGEVYLARHTRLGVLRALKILRRDTPGMSPNILAAVRERFVVEAQLGARLKHENLVEVYDFQEQEGCLVLVMEYAPGGNIAQQLVRIQDENKRFSIEWVIRVGQDIARGLAVLHQKDIVHRDLKPANVLLDSQWRARVADLGLAQGSWGGSASQLIAGSLDNAAFKHPGTPAYMSPEQANTFDHLTPASDVYALGLILFEMLSGRVYKNLKPGARLTSLRSDAPAWLEEGIRCMLAGDPQLRTWDGTEALAALQRGMQQNKREKEAEGARQMEAAAREKAEQEARHREEEQARIKALEVGLEADRKAEKVEFARKKGLLGTVWEENGRRLVGLGEKVVMAFVQVPGGEFNMGSDEISIQKILSAHPEYKTEWFKWEAPKHRVHLDSYWMGCSPVTNAIFDVFTRQAGYQTEAEKVGKAFVYKEVWKEISGASWQHPVGPGSDLKGKENHPVVQVSWNDAAVFCAWLETEIKKQDNGMQLRLPSEAQWEKAVRSTDGRIYPWGEKSPNPNLCNYGQNVNDTTPVGKYSPQGDSPCGCVDMAGNVWELVNDWFDKGYYAKSPDRNPQGPPSGQHRVLRGGSWYSSGVSLRSAYRGSILPACAYDDIGFRCVISAAP